MLKSLYNRAIKRDTIQVKQIQYTRHNTRHTHKADDFSKSLIRRRKVD